MYGVFYLCKHCYQKGAYITIHYLAGPPDYLMKCRYCKETWEGAYATPSNLYTPSPPGLDKTRRGAD